MICETEIGVCKCNVYKDYDEYSLLRVHCSLLTAVQSGFGAYIGETWGRALQTVISSKSAEKKIKDLIKRIVHVILKWAVKVRNIETLMATIFSFLSGPGQAQRNWVFATNSEILIPISLQPNVVELRYCKLWILSWKL